MEFNHFIKNKKVLLLGPASYFTSFNYKDDFTRYDTIVKINKMVEKPMLATEYLNTRNEVLYHNIDINIPNGDPPYEIEKWINKGVKHLRITHPGVTHYYSNNIQRFLHLNKQYNISFSIVEAETFNAVKRDSNTSPNAGTIAIYDIMNNEPKELRIKGITFCKTPYGNGYKEDVWYKNKNRSNQHNHNNQLKAFRTFYQSNQDTIILDDELIEILERYK